MSWDAVVDRVSEGPTSEQAMNVQQKADKADKADGPELFIVIYHLIG